VTCKPTITADQLAQMVASMLDKQKDSFCFKFGDTFVEPLEILARVGIQDGSVISQWENYPIKKDPNPPSVCVAGFRLKAQLVERVHALLGLDDLPKELERAVWRFLM
jgi:hypothetical protein